MGETTGISWTDGTGNFWKGCTKVSPACANCYMYRDAGMYGWEPSVVTRCKGIWKDILNPKKFKPGHKYFFSSWTDFWHPAADAWRNEAYDLLRQRKDIVIQFLTKRIERVADHLPPDWPWPNAWLGVTAENQEWWDKRVPLLLKIPAAVHFVSCGPTLGLIKAGEMAYVGLRNSVRGDWPIGHNLVAEPGIHPASINPQGAVWAHLPGGGLGVKPSEYEWAGKLDLVITEGESGPRARPSHPDWFRSLRDQCAAAGVVYHHKQNGEWVPVYDRDKEDPDWRNVPQPAHNERWLNLAGGQGFHGERVTLMRKVGGKAAGRLLDGVTWDKMPEARQPL